MATVPPDCLWKGQPACSASSKVLSARDATLGPVPLKSARSRPGPSLFLRRNLFHPVPVRVWVGPSASPDPVRLLPVLKPDAASDCRQPQPGERLPSVLKARDGKAAKSGPDGGVAATSGGRAQGPRVPAPGRSPPLGPAGSPGSHFRPQSCAKINARHGTHFKSLSKNCFKQGIIQSNKEIPRRPRLPDRRKQEHGSHATQRSKVVIIATL